MNLLHSVARRAHQVTPSLTSHCAKYILHDAAISRFITLGVSFVDNVTDTDTLETTVKQSSQYCILRLLLYIPYELQLT